MKIMYMFNIGIRMYRQTRSYYNSLLGYSAMGGVGCVFCPIHRSTPNLPEQGAHTENTWPQPSKTTDSDFKMN